MQTTLQQQHVLILGLGLSGLAMARWCARCGARVTVADSRTEPPQLATLRHDVPDARFVNATFDAALLQDQVRAVFASPGLKPADTHAVLDAAHNQGLWTGGELDLFVHALEALKEERGYAPHILGITGTNGKTTVTSLTGKLLERAGHSVAVAGNIGPTLLDTVGEKLDGDALPQSWVLELSSFQLYNSTAFEPTAATLLNLTQDHLDWHRDMADYLAAKTRVFGKQGTPVLNRDDAAVMALLPQLQATQTPETDAKPRGKKAAAKAPARRWISFGANVPQRQGDYGIEMVDGMAWLVRAMEDEAHLRSTRKTESAAPVPVQLQRLMPADALRIRGRHNACNALAALALATEAGAALAPMLYGLREYRGEPHRVEPIGVIDGVEYFDDSKGTNVGATLAALQGLGVERKLVVILGGEGKGQDFAPLLPAVRNYCRAVVLIGRDAALIETSLADAGAPLLHAASLQDAVTVAAEKAQAGDAVLLSPACASFDMFRDYVHRAEAFRAAVVQRAEERGLVLEGSA
ncbi:MAG: UDP-N-acetylmuramoyl-L-alanine--D-glutamate ligase [Brachymonas sp.]|nr:UDP-N-acetylmuramoyl-L-alanine--D-glutamate ligase [Brachymonas sp.]